MATKPPTRYVKWYNSMVHPSNLAAFCSAIISDHRKGQPGPRRFSGCVPATCGLAAPAGAGPEKRATHIRISKYQNPWVRRWLWFCVFLLNAVSKKWVSRLWEDVESLGFNWLGGTFLGGEFHQLQPSLAPPCGGQVHMFFRNATAERVPWHSPPSRPQSWSSLAVCWNICSNIYGGESIDGGTPTMNDL